VCEAEGKVEQLMDKIDNDNHVTQVWSCGGGTQSAAIAVLILCGKLPKPDYALMVDTERELSSTWDYMYGTLIPALEKFGLPMHLVRKSDYATKDLYGGADNDTLLLPAYTTSEGAAGRMPTYCSAEWKRDVAMRYMRKVLNIDQCQQWIGFSTDEMRRIRTPRTLWCQLRYPLIFDVPMNRDTCRKIVEAYGWPTPPRSSCWMCPHHSDKEWAHIKQSYPGDFQKAVELEREFRVIDPFAYLHKLCVPLDEIEFVNEDQQQQGTDECTSGMCFN
jgi:hypothetical protein